MDVFARSFPEQADSIRTLRCSDLVFAEICRDYELLMGLLPRDAADPVLADILHSLAALEVEIHTFLRTDTPCAGGPPNTN